MMGFSDLSNEIIFMIWDLVEVEDVYSFSTISKNVYLLTHELLREHYRLGQRLSNINCVCSESGVYGRVLKEILLNPRASRYPLLLKVDSWEFEWEETGSYSRGTVPESDLALFKQAIRENVDVSKKDLEEDWFAEIDKGSEEPLIALLLLLLPNLRDVKIASDVIGSCCISEILRGITVDEKSCSLSKLRSVDLKLMDADGDFLDFDYVKLFAAIPSVTSITGYSVGNLPDDIIHSLPSHMGTTNLTNLSLVECHIDPKTLAGFLSWTCNLQHFFYKPKESLANTADFDPFWIVFALLAHAGDTLKSLTVLIDGWARHYMGSLAEFECLESLETNLGFLIGDPSASYHTPLMILPSSIVDLKIRIDCTSDGPYYQASLQDIADHPKDFDRLENLTVVGVADVGASTISVASIASVLEARGTKLSLQ